MQATVTQGPTNFVYSANGNGTSGLGNSINYPTGSYQLSSGQTFTGLIESIPNEVAISIEVTIDQNATLLINQFMDSAGVHLTSSWTYSIVAGQPFSRSFTANGDYAQIVITNNGLATTTTLMAAVAYGNLLPVTQSGNLPIAVNEFASILSDSYNALPYLHVDPSYAATDGVTYNAVNVPQLGVMGAKVNLNSYTYNESTVAPLSADLNGNIRTRNDQLMAYMNNTQSDVLNAMLVELRMMNRILAAGLNVQDDVDMMRLDAQFEISVNTN